MPCQQVFFLCDDPLVWPVQVIHDADSLLGTLDRSPEVFTRGVQGGVQCRGGVGVVKVCPRHKE